MIYSFGNAKGSIHLYFLWWSDHYKQSIMNFDPCLCCGRMETPIIPFDIATSSRRFQCWQFNKSNCGFFTHLWWSFIILTWFSNWYVLGQIGWQPSKDQRLVLLCNWKKTHTFYVRCALCCTSNQFGYVNAILIDHGCKNQVVVIVYLQLLFTKP